MGNYNSKRNKAIANANKNLITQANDPAIMQAIKDLKMVKSGETGKNIDENIAYFNMYLKDLAELANKDKIDANIQAEIEKCEENINKTIKAIETGFAEYKKTHKDYDKDDYKKYSFMSDVIADYRSSQARMMQGNGYNINELQNEFDKVALKYHESVDKDIAEEFKNFEAFFKNENVDKAAFESILTQRFGHADITPEEFIEYEDRQGLIEELNDQARAKIDELHTKERGLQQFVSETNSEMQRELDYIDKDYAQKADQIKAEYQKKLDENKAQNKAAIEEYKGEVPQSYRENFIDQKMILWDYLVSSNVSPQYSKIGLSPEELNGDIFDWLTNEDSEQAVTDRHDFVDNLAEDLNAKQLDLSKKLSQLDKQNFDEKAYLKSFADGLGKEYALIDKYIYDKNNARPEPPKEISAEELEAEEQEYQNQLKEYEKQVLQVYENRRNVNNHLVATNQWLFNDYTAEMAKSLADYDTIDLLAKIKEAIQNGDTACQYPDQAYLDKYLPGCFMPDKPERRVHNIDPQIAIYEADKAKRITPEEKTALDKAINAYIEKNPAIIKLRDKKKELDLKTKTANGYKQKLSKASFSTMSSKDIAALDAEIKALAQDENSPFKGVDLAEEYKKYTDYVKSHENAQKVINSNTRTINYFKTFDIDKISNASKALNELLTDPNVMGGLEDLDQKTQDALESMLTPQLVNALDMLSENKYQINGPDSYAYASVVMDEYKVLANGLKNLNDPKAKLIKNKLLNAIKPLDEVTKNKDFVSALDSYSEGPSFNEHIFEQLAHGFTRLAADYEAEQEQIDDSIKHVQTNFLDNIIARQEKYQQNLLTANNMQKNLDQIEVDMSFCNKARNVLVAKRDWLQKVHEARRAEEKIQEINKQHDELINGQKNASQPIYDERDQKKAEATNKYDEKIESKKGAFKQDSDNLKRAQESLTNLGKKFERLGYSEQNVKEAMQPVADIQNKITRYNINAKAQLNKVKNDTYKELDAKESAAMQAVLKSTKAVGFNSQLFNDVAAAIQDYKQSMQAQAGKDLSAEEFDQISKKLNTALDKYIDARKEEPGKTKKGTTEGQIRLDAMRKLKTQLAMRKQQIADFKVEEESLKLPENMVLSVGTKFEEIIAKKHIKENDGIKLDISIHEKTMQKHAPQEDVAFDINAYKIQKIKEQQERFKELRKDAPQEKAEKQVQKQQEPKKQEQMVNIQLL